MAFRHLHTSLHRLHQSRFLRRPKGRLWVFRAIRLLKTSLPRIRTNHFFECPVCWKCVRIAFRHHEASLHRHNQSRILWFSEAILWVHWAIRLFNT
jgi:hypothetical protein